MAERRRPSPPPRIAQHSVPQSSGPHSSGPPTSGPQPSGPPPSGPPPSGSLLGQRSVLSTSELSCRLQSAIQGGDTEGAAELAAQMARQRGAVSVQTAPQTEGPRDTVKVKVHIEDRETRAGHVIVSVHPTMSVRRLKSKIFRCFGFPPEVQCWVIGRSLARDDDLLCDLMEVTAGSPLFLYLLSASAVGLTAKGFQDEHLEEFSHQGITNLLIAQHNRNFPSGSQVSSTQDTPQPSWQSDYLTHKPHPAAQGKSPSIPDGQSQQHTGHHSLWLSPKEANWTCIRCTYAENKPKSSKCELCEQEKPSHIFSFSGTR